MSNISQPTLRNYIGGRWVYIHTAPVFPNVYVGIGAAFGAVILAYFIRRRLLQPEL